MSDITVEVGAQFAFYVAGTYSATDTGTDFEIATGTTIDVVLTLSGVADGAAQQSAKADLGANRAKNYECLVTVDFTGEAPTLGQTVDIYWAPSTSGTAAKGNVAGNSGLDGVAPAGAVPATLTDDQFVLMCDYIGSLVITEDNEVQNGKVGVFSPSGRYGQIILFNNSGDVFETDNVEMAVFLTPIRDDVA